MFQQFSTQQYTIFMETLTIITIIRYKNLFIIKKKNFMQKNLIQQRFLTNVIIIVSQKSVRLLDSL